MQITILILFHNTKFNGSVYEIIKLRTAMKHVLHYIYISYRRAQTLSHISQDSSQEELLIPQFYPQ